MFSAIRNTASSAALFCGVATTASAAPIFSDTTPGLTSTTLAPGTYDIVTTGAGGGTGSNGSEPGGLGAVVEGIFTFSVSETLSILVGGQGTNSGSAGPGGGGPGRGLLAVVPPDRPRRGGCPAQAAAGQPQRRRRRRCGPFCRYWMRPACGLAS